MNRMHWLAFIFVFECLVHPDQAGAESNDVSMPLVDMVYFVPSDRQPTENFEAKIRWIARLMESVIAKDLKTKKYEARGPRFRRAADDRIVVDLVRGERTAAQYSQNFTWKSGAHANAIFEEINRRRSSTKTQMTFVFCETYSDDVSRKLWPGHIALARAQPPLGGVCCFSAWILKDEFASPDVTTLQRRFFETKPVRGRSALGHRGVNSPVADFMEDGIGGAIHELAHMFGLTHHSGNAPDRHIMAQGFRNLRWNVGLKDNPARGASFSDENASLLMTSRFINPNVDRTDSEPPRVEFSLRSAGKKIQVVIDAQDDKSLARVSVIQWIPSGGRELLTLETVSGANVRKEILVVPIGRPPIELQCIAVDGGGNFGRSTRRKN